MKKIFIISAIVLLSGINVIIFSQRSENPSSSLSAMFTIANANAETGNTKTLVIEKKELSGEIEVCGELACKVLGVPIGSITGCVKVMATYTQEIHTCPNPGSTC